MNELFVLIDDGGFVMIPLVIAALVLWYLIGLRLMSLRTGGSIATGIASLHKLETSLRERKAAFLELDIERYGVWIRSIVICAPLAGLLGTVDGMIETFDALGEMSLYRQGGGIAGGIAQALITTQMGLAVAIPGMLVGRLLDRRADQLKEKIAQTRTA